MSKIKRVMEDREHYYGVATDYLVMMGNNDETLALYLNTVCDT
jgi:hypothetical protein